MPDTSVEVVLISDGYDSIQRYGADIQREARIARRAKAVPVVGGGRPTLHFRGVVTGADATIAANAQASGVIWRDDGQQAAFITNAGSTAAISARVHPD